MSITLTPAVDTVSLRVTCDIEAKLTSPADPSFESAANLHSLYRPVRRLGDQGSAE